VLFRSFFLKDTSETLKLYPFQFELRLHYELIENSLKISYSVINRSNKLMPFSIGAHPAFAIKDCFSDYSLQFNATEEFVSYELENEHFNNVSRKIETENGLIALDYMLFKNDALVFKELKSNKITLLKNNLPYLSVTFDDIPYMGIWTKPNAPFLCIEPWCGLADTINHNGNIEEKEGIIKIQPHEIFYKTIQIEL
jgi:galactose mutarotase-like enzyme